MKSYRRRNRKHNKNMTKKIGGGYREMTTHDVMSGSVEKGYKFTRYVHDCKTEDRQQCLEQCIVIDLTPTSSDESKDENYAGDVGDYKLSYLIESIGQERHCYLYIDTYNRIIGYLGSGDKFIIVVNNEQNRREQTRRAREEPLTKTSPVLKDDLNEGHEQQSSPTSTKDPILEESNRQVEPEIVSTNRSQPHNDEIGDEDNDAAGDKKESDQTVGELKTFLKENNVSTALSRESKKDAEKLIQTVNNTFEKSKTASWSVEKFLMNNNFKGQPKLNELNFKDAIQNKISGRSNFVNKFDEFRSYPRIFQIVLAGYPSDLVTLITKDSWWGGNKAIELNTPKLLHDHIFTHTINAFNGRMNAITLAVYGRQRAILDILLRCLQNTYTPDMVNKYLMDPYDDASEDVHKLTSDVLIQFLFAEFDKPKNITKLILTYGNGNNYENFNKITENIATPIISPFLSEEGDLDFDELSVISNKIAAPFEEIVNKTKNWAFIAIMFIGAFILALFEMFVIKTSAFVAIVSYRITGAIITAILEIIKIIIYSYPRLMISRLKNSWLWNNFTTLSTLKSIVACMQPNSGDPKLDRNKQFNEMVKYANKRMREYYVQRTGRRIMHAMYDVATSAGFYDYLSDKSLLDKSFNLRGFHNFTKRFRRGKGGKKNSRGKTRKNKK